MKADQPTTVPALPTSTPVSGLEHHGPLPPKDDPSPVLIWLQNFWVRLKTGQIGNPKWIAMILGIALIGGAWWFFTYASKKGDSARWVQSDTSLTQDLLKGLTEDKTLADTAIGRIAKLNLSRAKLASGLRDLTATKLADRQKAATNLEEVRDELTKLADEFKSDRTLKTTCLLAAADAETALIGVPKAGVQMVGLDAKQNGRGQVDRVVELKKKAAEAIGDKTEAGTKLMSEADKLAKGADKVYEVAGILNAAFNEPDAFDPSSALPPIPKPPADGDGPKAPSTLPDPVNPIKPDEKKPDEKKPEEGPKAPAPLTPEKK